MAKFKHSGLRGAVIGAALAGGAIFGAATLQAQNSSTLPGTPNPDRVVSGTYNADPAHTLVGWSINHFGFNDYFGQFGNVEGSLVLDTSDLSASLVDVRIPISSVAVVSDELKTHLFKPGQNGARPDFFGPNPSDARFISQSVQQTGRSTALINGTLTLNGISRPVTLSTRFTGGGTNPFNNAPTVGFEARASIKRSDFGMTYGLPALGDQVDLVISAAFEKSSGTLTNKPGADGGDTSSAQLIPCGANRVRQFTGKRATAQVRKDITSMSGADSIRWVTPGQPVTLDYRPDRLNVTYSPRTNVISEMHCG